MTIIPVIDLAAGQVVHARAGLRADYQPLAATLAKDSDPVAVIAALGALYRFDSIYVADLEAIEDRGNQAATVQSLLREFPHCEFWLDAGSETVDLCRAHSGERLRPVIGSERHDCTALAAAVKARADSLLSLDFKDSGLLGDPGLLTHTELWPQDVIIMTLDEVGMSRGPDTERIRSVQALAPDRHYYAAGGIRDDDDLAALANIGVSGALIATALHAGTIRSFGRNHG